MDTKKPAQLLAAPVFEFECRNLLEDGGVEFLPVVVVVLVNRAGEDAAVIGQADCNLYPRDILRQSRGNSQLISQP